MNKLIIPLSLCLLALCACNSNNESTPIIPTTQSIPTEILESTDYLSSYNVPDALNSLVDTETTAVYGEPEIRVPPTLTIGETSDIVIGFNYINVPCQITVNSISFDGSKIVYTLDVSLADNTYLELFKSTPPDIVSCTSCNETSLMVDSNNNIITGVSPFTAELSDTTYHLTSVCPVGVNCKTFNYSLKCTNNEIVIKGFD